MVDLLTHPDRADDHAMCLEYSGQTGNLAGVALAAVTRAGAREPVVARYDMSYMARPLAT